MSILELFKVLYLKDAQLGMGEKVLLEVDKTRVESYGNGPQTTVFNNCKIIITTERLIIAQKMLWSKKYRVHYFVWFNHAEQNNGVKKGMVNLSCVKEKCISENNSITIIPIDTSIITKLQILNFNTKLP